MTRLRCHRFARSVSFALIGALLFGILAPPGAVISRAAAEPGAKTVLAFPAVDDSDAGDLADVAARVTSALALAGQDVREIDLEVFSPASPMVRRALADGSLRTADVEAPKDAGNALIIGQAFGVDSVVRVSAHQV